MAAPSFSPAASCHGIDAGQSTPRMRSVALPTTSPTDQPDRVIAAHALDAGSASSMHPPIPSPSPSRLPALATASRWSPCARCWPGCVWILKPKPIRHLGGLAPVLLSRCRDGRSDGRADSSAARMQDALPHGVDLGIAMQLTNILRDIGEDARRWAGHLPLEDLAAFDCNPEAILCDDQAGDSPTCLAFEIARARALYANARRGLPALSPSGRLTALAGASSTPLSWPGSRRWTTTCSTPVPMSPPTASSVRCRALPLPSCASPGPLPHRAVVREENGHRGMSTKYLRGPTHRTSQRSGHQRSWPSRGPRARVPEPSASGL